MSDAVTPVKRSHEQLDLELEGKEKWQKSSPAEKSSRGNGKANCVLRILCPSFKVDNVLGEGGSTLASIKQDSGAEVTFEDHVPGCDERVVAIVGVCDGGMESAKHTAIDGADRVDVVSANVGINKQHEDDKGDYAAGNEAALNTKFRDSDLEDCKFKNYGGNNVNEKEKDLESNQSKSLKAAVSAQKALILVVDKMAEGAGVGDGKEGNKKPSPFVVRMLVLSNQDGCLLGKGGSVIKQMSAESGAQIRILPRDKLPLCASGFNELSLVSLGLFRMEKWRSGCKG